MLNVSNNVLQIKEGYMKQIVITILLIFAVHIVLAVPSIVVNAGSIVVIEEASVIINNGELIINQTDGFYSDNTDIVVESTPVDVYGPEGINDAVTITASGDMGSVQIINYSGMIYPGSTTTINHWWKFILTTEQTCSITFRMRNGDLSGFEDLSFLTPYEKTINGWQRMSLVTPTYSSANGFTEIAFTGVNWLTKKGSHDVTLGLYMDPTLPVELSSFTGIATAQNYVKLQWTTQSETSISGYYIFRNRSNNLESAERINSFIDATNTSNEVEYSFTDKEVLIGNTWYYWLQHIEMNGEFEFHGPISVEILDSSSDIPVIPLVTSLQAIYPNPFNAITTIAYGLAKKDITQIVIFNLRGEKIRSLLNTSKNPGSYRINWDGLSDNGRPATSGIYFVKMTAGKYSTTQKIILMK